MYVERLRERGKTMDSGKLYARGRIVLFVPAGSAIRADSDLEDLASALTDGRLKKLAMANPDHAPYGRAAREALEAAGLWDKVRSRLVLGENASQAAQFAASGSAQAGIIPLSLAAAPAMAGKGRYATIPESSHRPLRQRMVLLAGAGETASAFYDFLQKPEAQAILQRYGFITPSDQ
jgi:molybdate transport system substrate-binding protein